MMENTKDPMIVCSCCSCCCEVLSMLKKFSTPNQCTSSNFEAVIDTENCVGCKACAKICPMDAISLIEKKAVVDYARCIGCGVCVPKCNKNNIALKYREKISSPADSLPELLLSNYYKSKNTQDNFLPKLTLGATRLLAKASPLHMTGPRAMTFKEKK